MHLYIECTKCHRKLYLFEGVNYTLACQGCGNDAGVFHITNESVPRRVHLQCVVCNQIIPIKTEQETELYHQCLKNKKSKILRIFDIEKEKIALMPVIQNKSIKVSAIILCHNKLDLTQKCIEDL